jgi:hypothetical protein
MAMSSFSGWIIAGLTWQITSPFIASLTYELAVNVVEDEQ